MYIETLLSTESLQFFLTLNFLKHCFGFFLLQIPTFFVFAETHPEATRTCSFLNLFIKVSNEW